MQSSLGIYIEDNIIKYAKLQKDRDFIKVEAYNVVFYDGNLENTLNKIISETYSYKIPVSLNISDEMYETFEKTTLLNKGDIRRAIELDFETLCAERGYNKNSLEQRYIFVDDKGNSERIKALNIIANKSVISKRLNMFNNNKVATITPITTSIANLIDIDGRENIIVVNIEEKTKITTIIDGQIYQIDVLEEGMGKILEEINKVENSFSKSYEVCKNLTIYTHNSEELYNESNEYMDIVTSVLYKIVSEVKNITNEIFTNVDKIYITGLGTCINNIDLYFQEYISLSKCEILKPYFTNSGSLQIPIKDYIEVNSAIALALEGLGFGNKDLNFAKLNSSSTSILSKEIDLSGIKNYFEHFGEHLQDDFSQPLGSVDKLLIRSIFAFLAIILLFMIFSSKISSQIALKKVEIAEANQDAVMEMSKLNYDLKLIQERKNTYNDLIDEITNPVTDSTNDEESVKKVTISKDSIPNLLNRVMFVIPKKVKLTSIKNTTSNHIEIKAEAEKYEQLGYFKAVLSTNGILLNVKSTSGQKNGKVVQVTIEGDLP